MEEQTQEGLNGPHYCPYCQSEVDEPGICYACYIEATHHQAAANLLCKLKKEESARLEKEATV